MIEEYFFWFLGPNLSLICLEIVKFAVVLLALYLILKIVSRDL